MTRALALTTLAVLAAAPSGCGANHVRDCGGGLELRVYVPIDDLDAAESLYILVGIDGSEDYWENVWDASLLDDNGFGDLVLNLAIEEPTRLTIRGELRGADDVLLASATESYILQPLDTGCQTMDLGMGGAGRDGSVIDAEELPDAEGPPDACMLNPDQCPADAGGPPDSVQNMDGSPGDFDGDLVPDDEDNCPWLYNPDQADEDGDTVGNVCDNCPVHDNLDQLNTDPDEVGDICDPHLNDATWSDSIQWMDGFNGTGAPSGYVFLGTWTKSGGRAQNSSDTGTSALQVVTFGANPVSGDDELRVYTRATVGSVNADGSGPKGPGVTVFTSGNLSSGWRCQGALNTDILSIIDQEANQVVSSTGPWPVTTGAAHDVIVASYPNSFFSAQNIDCTYSLPLFSTDDTLPQSKGQSFGITASGAIVQFDYLFAVLSKSNVIEPPGDGGPTGDGGSSL